MCGRATLTTPGDELRDQLGLDAVPTVVPRFNIAPSQPIAVIKTPRILSFAAFGLSSFTGKPGRTINLRAESLPNVPAYREAFKHHRCLVVVDGFFEWQTAGEEEPRQKRLFADTARKARTGRSQKGKQQKQAFLIRRADGAAFTLAGIWAPVPTAAPANDAVECAIVTGPAAGVIASLHDRMPVIVAPTARGVWLSGAESAGPGEARMHVHPDLRHLLSRQVIAAGGAELIAIPVGPRVNSPAFDDEEVLRPAADPHRL